MKADAKNIIKFPLKCVKCVASHEIDIDIMTFVAKSMMKVVVAGSVAVSIATIMFAYHNADALRYQAKRRTPTPIERRQQELEAERQKEIDAWLTIHMPSKKLKDVQ